MSDRQGTSQSEQVPASPTESEPSSQPDALIDFQMSPHGLGLMGQRQQVRDHMDLIKTVVDASPTKVAVVGVRVTEGASRRSRSLINTLAAQNGGPLGPLRSSPSAYETRLKPFSCATKRDLGLRP